MKTYKLEAIITIEKGGMEDVIESLIDAVMESQGAVISVNFTPVE